MTIEIVEFKYMPDLKFPPHFYEVTYLLHRVFSLIDEINSSTTLQETSNMLNTTSRETQECRHDKDFKHRSFQQPLGKIQA